MTQQRRSQLPTIRPMLATAGKLPASDGWAFEFKWDGVRAVTYVREGSVRALSRNDRDITRTYPELEALGDLLDTSPAVLDGEIVAFDKQGKPSFADLQSRMHVQRPNEDLLRRVPVAYYVFDVLHLSGDSLLRVPYTERRERLDELGLSGASRVDVSPCFLDADGEDVMQAAYEQSLEGVIAKQRDSTYEPGRRSRKWIKVPLIKTQEAVIGGWKEGQGSRAGTIGSLLLGAYEGDALRYIGHVGTGFTDSMLKDLHRRLRGMSRRDSPFADGVPRADARGAHWVSPDLVGEVEYRQWTQDGRLRHPAWRGLRPDKEPGEVSTPAS